MPTAIFTTIASFLKIMFSENIEAVFYIKINAFS